MQESDELEAVSMSEAQKAIFLARQTEQQAERARADKLCPLPQPPKSQGQIEQELHDAIGELHEEVAELVAKLDEALVQLDKEQRSHRMEVRDLNFQVRKLKKRLGLAVEDEKK